LQVVKRGTKIIHIFSNLDYSRAMLQLLSGLKNSGHEVSAVFLSPRPPLMMEELQKNNIACHYISYNGKSSIPRALFKCWWYLLKNRSSLVHVHLFEASLIGLTASFFAGIRKRIMTRHHTDHHLRFFPSALKYDRYSNRMATKIIAISKNASAHLIQNEKAPREKIVYIPHGFDFSEFTRPETGLMQQKRSELGIPEKAFVVGVISRANRVKGVEYTVEAFKKLWSLNNNVFLILGNFQGDKKTEILKSLEELPSGTWTEAGFEKNVNLLFSLMHCFVHVPVDPDAEPFGQVFIESLALSVPSVFSASGIGAEICREGNLALEVPFRDSEAIFRAVKKIMDDPETAGEMAKRGKAFVEKKFTLNKMLDSLAEVYHG
jgi:glycosyltransferase involved in cell wall biosynthesis